MRTRFFLGAAAAASPFASLGAGPVRGEGGWWGCSGRGFGNDSTAVVCQRHHLNGAGVVLLGVGYGPGSGRLGARKYVLHACWCALRASGQNNPPPSCWYAEANAANPPLLAPCPWPFPPLTCSALRLHGRGPRRGLFAACRRFRRRRRLLHLLHAVRTLHAHQAMHVNGDEGLDLYLVAAFRHLGSRWGRAGAGQEKGTGVGVSAWGEW